MAHATGKPGHVPVPIRANLKHLSENDRFILGTLIQAAKAIDAAYLMQMRIQTLPSSATFTKPAIPLFYPEDATKVEIDAYLEKHPEQREGLLSPFTVVVGSENGFKTVPYNQVHKAEFERVSELLTLAAKNVQAPLMKAYLEKRAGAFRTNEYRESDVAWIHANDAFFELTIGPYESYSDPLFGVKRTLEAVLGLVLKHETHEAALYQSRIQSFDETLSMHYGYDSSPTLTPMIVIDEVWAAGESLYEYIPMAYNLPNDLDIRKEVGSKKVFIKNVMDAKMRTMTKPIGERVLHPQFLSFLNIETALFFVMGHEAAHGLSFHFDGENFGPIHSSVEECKADVFGILFLYFLSDQDRFNVRLLDSAVITHVVDCVRQVRFGIHEAHAAGALIQLSWLSRQGALTIADGSFSFDPARFRDSFQGLGDALYSLSCTKSEQAAKEFVAEHGKIPAGLEAITELLSDIPTDIDPEFAL